MKQGGPDEEENDGHGECVSKPWVLTRVSESTAMSSISPHEPRLPFPDFQLDFEAGVSNHRILRVRDQELEKQVRKTIDDRVCRLPLQRVYLLVNKITNTSESSRGGGGRLTRVRADIAANRLGTVSLRWHMFEGGVRLNLDDLAPDVELSLCPLLRSTTSCLCCCIA